MTTQANTAFTLKIERDEDDTYANPRDNDNLGTMVCFHRNYNLGDTGHNFNMEDYNGWDSLATAIERENPGAVILPLYLYDHSGITISTGSFSCPWDSGQIGFIFISGAKIRDEYSVKRITKALRERITSYLVSEVEQYDLYLTGEVYGYIIEDALGDEVEACWGFLGKETAQSEGEAALKCLTNSTK